MIKDRILLDLIKDEPKTYLHFGDGDYYFLTQQAIGSAKPGNRALSKDYKDMNMQPFIDGVLKNDYICMEYEEQEMIKNFHKIYPNREIDYNLTDIYAYMATKWLLQFDKVGLIGAGPKIELIKELMKFKEYQTYLEVDEFTDYITVPQKYLADDIETAEKDICKQLEKAESNVILYGIGHAKTALAWTFKKYHNAIYIDVGAGIDMLAGIYDYQRPFGMNWINYRLHRFDYDKLDLMYFQSRSNDVWLD